MQQRWTYSVETDERGRPYARAIGADGVELNYRRELIPADEGFLSVQQIDFLRPDGQGGLEKAIMVVTEDRSEDGFPVRGSSNKFYFHNGESVETIPATMYAALATPAFKKLNELLNDYVGSVH